MDQFKDTYFSKKIHELEQVDSEFAAFLEQYREVMMKKDFDNFVEVEFDMNAWASENIEG